MNIPANAASEPMAIGVIVPACMAGSENVSSVVLPFSRSGNVVCSSGVIACQPCVASMPPMLPKRPMAASFSSRLR